MAGSPRVQPPSAFRGWRDETVFVVVVLNVAWCGLLAVGLAVDCVEYCTGYPIVECGPISASALGRLVLGRSLLGLIPSVLLSRTRVLPRTEKPRVMGLSEDCVIPVIVATLI